MGADRSNPHPDVAFRMLDPEEGAVLGEAIRAAYGDSYDAAWVYDTDEVGRRLADGTYVSCVAEGTGGSLLCHVGLGRNSPGDLVGHSGQAVTMPEARGQHLFTATKRRLIEWARDEGLAGMYGEATAAHPYSERANVELGAHETGFRAAVLTVHRPGADLEARVSAERSQLFGGGFDAIYVDMPMETPATALAADHLEALGVFYSGIFPNTRADGDVLRMQSLNGVEVSADDVAVASEHGRELLEYVLGDLTATHG